MRVMVMVKASASSEAGKMPDEELLTDMENFNEKLAESGIIKAGEGLKASSQGVRVHFHGSDRTVTDGPFAETKESIAGYWFWEVHLSQQHIVQDNDLHPIRFAGGLGFGMHGGDRSLNGVGSNSPCAKRTLQQLAAFFHQLAIPMPDYGLVSIGSRSMLVSTFSAARSIASTVPSTAFLDVSTSDDVSCFIFSVSTRTDGSPASDENRNQPTTTISKTITRMKMRTRMVIF